MASTLTKTETGLSLTGKLVFDSVSGLLAQAKQVIEQSLASEQTEIVIDCNKMERIDSAGIALLLQWQRDFKAADKTCRLEGLSNQAVSLIQAYRFKTHLNA